VVGPQRLLTNEDPKWGVYRLSRTGNVLDSLLHLESLELPELPELLEQMREVVKVSQSEDDYLALLSGTLTQVATEKKQELTLKISKDSGFDIKLEVSPQVIFEISKPVQGEVTVTLTLWVLLSDFSMVRNLTVWRNLFRWQDELLRYEY
jgi:hypothetical protein